MVRNNPSLTMLSNKSKVRLKYPLVSIVLIFFMLCLLLLIFFYHQMYKEMSHASHNYAAGYLTLTAASAIDKAFNFKKSHVPAYVVSLILCNDEERSGFLDAAAVLRHSIHKNSIHNPGSNAKYSYKMYAIIHDQCAHYESDFERIGYETIIQGTPIDRQQIKNDFYKRTVDKEGCCGTAEFVKLHVYKLTQHPVVVYFELDSIVLKPMDDLFDSIIYNHDSPQSTMARKRIEVEQPEDTLPVKINAFFTRDYQSSLPWQKNAGVQSGFLVVRPSQRVYHQYINIILEGNYKIGYDNQCGWGGLGYGGFPGAKTFRGVVAYFYGEIDRGTAVELDVCKWNQIAGKVFWTGGLGSQKFRAENIECNRYSHDDNNKLRLPGQPKLTNTGCDDCSITPIDQPKTVHYSACKKPWSCPTSRQDENRGPNKRNRIHTMETEVHMCYLLHKEWFKLRKEFDELLYSVYNDEIILSRSWGKYNVEHFLGYCKDESKYLSIKFPQSDFFIERLYPQVT